MDQTCCESCGNPVDEEWVLECEECDLKFLCVYCIEPEDHECESNCGEKN